MPEAIPPWTAVIPLRAGSKGLAGKNMRPLAGKPLYRYSLDLALDAGAEQVLISTDIEELLAESWPEPVRVISRPAELCGDAVPGEPVLLHLLDVSPVDGTVVLLQATSPLRRREDVEAALALFARGEHELVMSVTEADSGVLKWGRLEGERFVPLGEPGQCFANRQSLPQVVRPNGAVLVFEADWLRSRRSLVGGRIGAVCMPPERSLDIDTLTDFEACEAALAAAP